MQKKETLATSSSPVSSETAQNVTDDDVHHDSDDEQMVYETAYDYATSARQERDRLLAEGSKPDFVILQSELGNYIPRQNNESQAEFVERYAMTMNDMISRGVIILNDLCTTNVVASVFSTADGRYFDLGPGSGATKGEFRRFSRWFSENAESGEPLVVPEEWLKFEE